MNWRMRRSDSARCASALSTLSSNRFKVCPTMPTSLFGSVSSGWTLAVMRWSSPVSGVPATSAAVTATRRNGRSAYPTTRAVSPAVTSSAAIESTVALTIRRLMVLLTRPSDSPTTNTSSPALVFWLLTR